MDRLDLAVRATRADHEVVRVVDDAAHVELDDVARLLVLRVGGDRRRQLAELTVEPPRPRCRRRPRPGPGSRSRALRAPARAAPTRRCPGAARRCSGSAPSRAGRQAAADLLAAGPRALRDRHRREPEDRLRLVPARQRPGHVSSDDEGQLVTGSTRMDLTKRIDRVRRPVALDLERADLEPVLVAGDGTTAHLEPVSGTRLVAEQRTVSCSG